MIIAKKLEEKLTETVTKRKEFARLVKENPSLAKLFKLVNSPKFMIDEASQELIRLVPFNRGRVKNDLLPTVVYTLNGGWKINSTGAIMNLQEAVEVSSFFAELGRILPLLDRANIDIRTLPSNAEWAGY